MVSSKYLIFKPQKHKVTYKNICPITCLISMHNYCDFIRCSGFETQPTVFAHTT